MHVFNVHLKIFLDELIRKHMTYAYMQMGDENSYYEHNTCKGHKSSQF